MRWCIPDVDFTLNCIMVSPFVKSIFTSACCPYGNNCKANFEKSDGSPISSARTSIVISSDGVVVSLVIIVSAARAQRVVNGFPES
jgi:hypothetical protein